MVDPAIFGFVQEKQPAYDPKKIVGSEVCFYFHDAANKQLPVKLADDQLAQ
jgi:hypothetical protein